MTGVMTDGLMVAEGSTVVVAPPEDTLATGTRSSTKLATRERCESGRDTRTCRRLEILGDRRSRPKDVAAADKDVRTSLVVGRGEGQQDGRAHPRADVCDSLDLVGDRAVEGRDHHTSVQGRDLNHSSGVVVDSSGPVLAAV